ncbi:MAG TPA: hypothetical protein VG796_21000 [Verrucomicrobiales bacterium]|jgi:hypothetical protein|nr:hypothetical protein [Verrucomicrobiales bacterium]
MTPRLLFLAFTALASAQEAAAPAAPAPQKVDFETLMPGAVPDEFMSTDQEAKFVIAADGEKNKVLELQGQPIVDGGMLVGKAVKGPATITARIKATGKRRVQPRFGVGLYGISGPRIRVVPVTKTVEIVKNTDKEEVVATAPYTWTSGTWIKIEMTVKAAASGGGSTIEARVWDDGKPRPEKATVTWENPAAAAQGRASVWGTPYSEQAIWFDDIEIKTP